MKHALILLLLATPVLAQDQVWTWTDDQGEEHYTNDKGSIPDKFRARAKPTAGQELSVVKTRDEAALPSPEPVKVAPTKASPATAPRATPGAIKVVLFEASTNSASKTLSRSGVVDKLVVDNPGLKLERVEFSTAVERAEKLGVTQLPTVLFVDDTGTAVARSTGLVTLKELQRLLDKARGAVQ